GVQLDIALSNALINMFGSSNQACEAWKVFDATHNKNIVSWNAMLSAHSQNGHFEETIAQMALTKMVKPNKLTFACANLKNLREGKLAHAAAVEAGLEFAVPVAATLIQMYSKCHCLEEARDIFSQSPSSDVVAWTVMISAYAQNCRPQEAIALFRMTVPPDSVAFATVGLGERALGVQSRRGCQCFASIVSDYKMVPSRERQGCVVDLLPRAGSWISEDLIRAVAPSTPSSELWKAVLSACRIHLDVELGECAAACVLEM
ncbi:hypothetical protein SELMODRAFT_43584, partial [Selaginella moellendorffii]